MVAVFKTKYGPISLKRWHIFMQVFENGIQMKLYTEDKS